MMKTSGAEEAVQAESFGIRMDEEHPAEAKQVAEKGLRSSENPEEHTPGAEAHADFIGLLPGINPRPTARLSFSAACKAQVDCDAFAARLKSFPVTKPLNISSRMSFIAAWKRLLAGCRLWREESGDSLVEMALSISLIGLPLLVGTVELGTMRYGSIEVSNAAQAGAEYGMMSSTFAADSAGIVSAAQGEASDFGANLSVTPTVYFACSQSVGGAQYPTQSAANAACTGTLNHSLEFVQVSTSTTVTPPIRCPGLASSYTLVGLSVMEIEE
jgi:Flp pilus assembly protein TadG